MNLLPPTIPEYLSAQQYYELGLRYRLAGWVGLARETLSRAAQLDQAGQIKAKAEKVIRTQLPRLPVPAQAEQKNIEGYNLMASNVEQAKSIFRDLMNQYPDFEWPFSNLARIYMSEGKLADANGLGKYLLSVNPDSIRALSIMLEISLAHNDYSSALGFIQRGLALYPDDELFRQLLVFVKTQAEGLPPDVLPTNLEPTKYYELGINYEMSGKLNLARQAFEQAISAEPESELSNKIRNYIMTHLPRHPVSEETEKRYTQSMQLISTNKELAAEELEKMILDEPDFEMPLFSLARLCLDEHPQKAEHLLKKVLTINPHLGAAISLLIMLYVSETRLSEGLALLEKVLPTLTCPDQILFLDLLKAQLQLQQDRH
jgi:tetratricopeptide (TPR) repeat protein